MTVQRLPNVRPRPSDYDDDFDSEDSAVDGNEGAGVESRDEEVDRENEDAYPDDEAAEQGLEYGQQISSISFGALKQAQDSLSRKRRRGSENTADQEEKLEALRKRLRQIKDAKASTRPARLGEESTTRFKPGSKRQPEESNDEHDDDGSESGPSEEDEPSKARTSKHAPTSMSSKRQVTRKRTVVGVPKRVVRDPRFDAISQRPTSVHPGNSEKAYGFLRDYQKDEIKELKAAMKKTKNDEDKEILKRKIGSMENRLKAKEAKEREQDIIRQHRKEELEKVQQGKTPYYLKKKDIKERALVEKFKRMKGKDREKAIEKRKRKEGQKEKKRMPEARRLAG